MATLAKTKKPPTVFVVDRSRWINANTQVLEGDGSVVDGSFYSVLLNPHLGSRGMMCCLGFVCNQLGVPKKALLDVGMPVDLGSHEEAMVGVLTEECEMVIRDNALTLNAAGINDDKSTTRQQKEVALKKLFKEHKLTIRFEGVAPVKPVKLR